MERRSRGDALNSPIASDSVSRRTTLGVVLTVLSALAFGTLALFARKAYDSGVDPATLLMLRFGIAALLLGGVVAAGRQPLPGRKELWPLLLMGGLYVGQSFCFFAALKHAPASLVSLMLYLYPGIVTVLAVTILKERMTAAKTAALVLAIVGSILTIGPVRLASQAGILFGVGTALFYSAYIVVGSWALRRVPATVASFVIIGTAAVTYGALTVAQGPHFPASPLGWMWCALLAVVSTVFAISAFLGGLERIGPVNASTLSAIEPVATVLFSMAFLGERLLPMQMLGGVAILSAVFVLARGARQS